jgi:tRNA(adenine34) deaminase
MLHPNSEVMMRAIELARKGFQESGQATAAVVVKGSNIIAEDFTSVMRDKDSTCHAEMNAIRAAMKNLGHKRLEECYLYATFEPCPMCTSAAIWAKMKGIIYGASREDHNEYYTWRVNIPAQEVVNRSEPKLELYPEFMRNECKELLLLKK